MTGLRTGQVARAARVNQQTLRYYERRGLLDAPDRTPGGHRLYPAETVTVLQVVKAAQRLGFSLEEIIDLLDTGRHRHAGSQGADLAERAAVKLAEIEAKITDLTVMAATLRAALQAGCADLIECAGEPHCPLPFAGRADAREAENARP